MSNRSFFGFRKTNKSQSHYKRTLRMEALEERALLSAVPLSTSEYANLRAEYAEFNLPANMADLNVITLDLAQGDGLSQLKSAITQSGTTTKSDLIVVRTSDSANTINYTAANNELIINVNASQYGAVTIVGFGSKPLTLDAKQLCRAINISSASSVVNLGGLTIQNGSSAAYNGGGIYNNGTTIVNNCTISGNTSNTVAGDLGGGGGIFNSGNLTVNKSAITGNTAGIRDSSPQAQGGGILNTGVLNVTDTTFSGNFANWGGGVYNLEESATSTITNCSIFDNIAGYGGGAFNELGYLSIINSTVSGNSTNYRNGGGIDSNGTLYVINSTVSNNSAIRDGGGIYNGGMIVITNSVISGNTSQRYGGGICSAHATTIVNSTIVGNTADYYYKETNTNSSNYGKVFRSGGGIHVDGGSVNLSNTIIVFNSDYDNSQIFSRDDPAITGSNNLSSFTAWSGSGNLVYNADLPLFVDAANGDYSLAAGSQAIDKGSNMFANNAGLNDSSKDLAGNRRFIGGIDIGAYEYQPIDVAVSGKKITVSWTDDSPAADAVRYRVANTTKWTTKKLKAGVTEFSFNGALGTQYEIEVLLDQQEGSVLESSAVVLDQAKLKADKAFLKDDTFQVEVTNYNAKNLASNSKQAILTVNGVQTTVDIVNKQGTANLTGGGKVSFSNGTFTFTEMNSVTSYKVQVSFSGGNSESTASSALTVKTTKTCYLKPVITSATALSDTSIVVEWETSVGKGTNTPAQKYTVQYSTDGVKWTNATTGATGNSFTIQKLKGGVDYKVRVLATKDSAFESSLPSEVKTATTLTLPKAALDKTSLKDDTFKLNVTNYQNSNLATATSVTVKSDKFGTAAIQLQNGSGSASFANGMTVSYSNGVLTFTNAPSNTPQKIQLSFKKGVCTTAWSAAVSVKTTIAPYNKPVLKSATAVSSTSVQVEWNAVTGKNSDTPAQKYTVQYSLDGVKWKNATTSATGTSYTINNLKPNTKYLVAVIANKDAKFNASQPSNSEEVTTRE